MTPEREQYERQRARSRADALIIHEWPKAVPERRVRLWEQASPNARHALESTWPEIVTEMRRWRSAPRAVAFNEPDGAPPPCVWQGSPSHDRFLCLTCQTRVEWVRVKAREMAAEHEASGDAEAWAGVTGDLFDPEEPEPEPSVLEYGPGLFAFTPGISFVFGRRAALKTWLTYEAIRQVLAQGGHALLIDYEMSHSEAMRRFYTLGATKADLSRLVYVKPPGRISPTGREALVRRLEVPPDVVVLDSVGMSMSFSGLSTNDETEVGEWAEGLPLWMKLEWPGAVILCIDHVPKSSEGSPDPIGSQRKGAFADAMYEAAAVTRMSRATRGSGMLTVRKDRRGYSDEGVPLLTYEFGGGGPFVLAAPTPGDLVLPLDKQPEESTEDQVLADLAKAGHEGIGKTDLTGRGDRGNYRRQALLNLVNDGRAVERKEGRGRSIRVYLPEHAPTE